MPDTNYLVQGSDLTSIANAIRTKGGTSAQLEFPDEFIEAIGDISTGITPTGTKNINSNGTHDVTQYASANVQVPNTYSAGDEGKVVSNGALVAQGSDTVTENDTYDTTLISSLTVNVSGGGGGGYGEHINLIPGAQSLASNTGMMLNTSLKLQECCSQAFLGQTNCTLQQTEQEQMEA